jgi:hypothetical protein
VESDLLDVSEAIARARAGGAPRAEVDELLAHRNRLILEARAAGMSNRAIGALADVSKWMVIKVRRQHGPLGAPRDGADNG